MQLEFQVDNQKLIRKDTTEIVNQTVKDLCCEINFKSGTGWDSIDKYVIFKSETGKNYCVPLGNADEDIYIHVPGKVLEGDFFRMTIFGIDEDRRITTTESTILLIRSGFTTDLQPYDSNESGDIFSSNGGNQ